MDYKDCFSWSEYDWEREIRKDDARVSAYITELPRYIDLPGEDNILIRTIKRRLGTEKEEEDWGPVPADEENLSIFPSAENWRAVPGGPVYHNCAVLARDFSLGAATCTRDEIRPRIMRVLTLYGQLMARAADLIDMSLEKERAAMDDDDCDVPPNLIIAAVKRLLSYQNKLAEELRLLEEESPEMAAHADAHLEATGMMHDYLIDLLYFIRNKNNPAEDDVPF